MEQDHWFERHTVNNGFHPVVYCCVLDHGAFCVNLSMAGFATCGVLDGVVGSCISAAREWIQHGYRTQGGCDIWRGCTLLVSGSRSTAQPDWGHPDVALRS